MSMFSKYYKGFRIDSQNGSHTVYGCSQFPFQTQAAAERWIDDVIFKSQNNVTEISNSKGFNNPYKKNTGQDKGKQKRGLV